jgi:hypothetical protein
LYYGEVSQFSLNKYGTETFGRFLSEIIEKIKGVLRIKFITFRRLEPYSATIIQTVLCLCGEFFQRSSLNGLIASRADGND